ncbi:MAG: hypothetical protein JW938_03395 [Candidatus Omnitrophica bacterium]|nr:hypothetical protein [Candidatus Omnitrophota bacterium]
MKIFRSVVLIIVSLAMLFMADPLFAFFGSVKAPDNVRLQIIGDKVLLRWEDPYKDTEGYNAEIEVGEADRRFERVDIVPLSSCRYLDYAANLRYDVTYMYRIRTVAENQKTSKWVEAGSVTIPKPRYEAIEDWSVSLTRDQQGILIVWNVDESAQRTIVVERSMNGDDYEEIARVVEDVGLHVDRNVEDESEYSYRIYIDEDEFARASEYSDVQTIEYAVKRFAPVVLDGAEIVEEGLNKWGIRLRWQHKASNQISSWNDRLLVEIERKISDGDFERLNSLLGSKGSYTDTTVTAGNDILGEKNGYEIKGSVYTYRVRYGASADFAASKWVETEGIQFGFMTFNAPVIKIGPSISEGSIMIMWDDLNAGYDPVGKLERKAEGAISFREIARVNESDGSFEDTNIEKDKTYNYRLIWNGQSGMHESSPGLSVPARAMTPEYTLPGGIKAVLQDKGRGSYEVIISWDGSASGGEPIIEVERSINSRDYVPIQITLLSKSSIVDDTVTHKDGSPRTVNGQDVLLNVYKYRVRLRGDEMRRPSIWYESDDIYVLGPARS